jgi:acid phosphatase (class A)
MSRFRPALLIQIWFGLALLPLLAEPPKVWPKPVPTFIDPAAPALRAALPPPPAAGSLAAAADLETVLQVQAWRTPDQVALSLQLVQDDPFKFAEAIGPQFNGQNFPRTAELLRKVLADTYAVSLTLKDVYTRKRPHLEDPRVEPCVERTTTPSYPSGHSTRSYVTATILSDLFPERRGALQLFARKAAWVRVQGGIHYPTDLEGGRLLAVAIVEALQRSEAFQKALAECQAEVAVQALKMAVPYQPLAETAEFKGRKVTFTQQGAGKETLVLIHGWTCDGGFWSANVPELAKRYRVLTLDLPGHGQSDKCATCTMEEFGDAVFAVMDAAKVPRGILVGHSMGGAVMLASARRQPGRIKAIVAVDAVFIDAASAEKYKNAGARFAGPQGMEAREKTIKSMFTPATPKPVQEQILRAMLAAPEAVAVGAMNGMFTPSFWKDDVIQIPFLQIAAGTSTWMSEEALRKRFPQAQLKRIEGTGHFLMMEKPEAFNHMLLDWVEGLKP